jgi:hypothetical protein
VERVAVAAARRNKGVWSSLGLGLSLALSSDFLVTFLVILLVIFFLSMVQV